MKKDNKITVLYVHANNTDIGGADYCLFKLADELDKSIFTPIVCLSVKTDIVDLYDKAGIKTYVISMERIKKNKNPIYLIKLLTMFLPTIYTIVKIIKSERVDIVQGNDLLDIYGPIAGRLTSKSVTQYIRWILPSPDWLRIILTRLVHKLNHRILTVSNGVAKDMFTRNGKRMPNVITCYDWIDMDKVGHDSRFKNENIRKDFGISPDALVVGNVGRLDPWKGQDVFINAAANLLKHCPECHFVIVGGEVFGSGREVYGDKLKEMVSSLNISDNVVFTGHRSDIFNIMKTFDVFVHSSVSPDPLPGVVMEAQFCEVPVVGANSGGVPEEIENNVTGLLYEMGNADDMANKIYQLLDDVQVRRNMGKAGRNRMLKVFNKKLLCKDIENIYLDLIND